MTDRQRQLLREIADGKLADAPGVGSGWRKRAWTSLAGKAAMLDDTGKPILTGAGYQAIEGRR